MITNQLSPDLSPCRDQNDIILYELPSNTTHTMQPDDVRLFKALKNSGK